VSDLVVPNGWTPLGVDEAGASGAVAVVDENATAGDAGGTGASLETLRLGGGTNAAAGTELGSDGGARVASPSAAAIDPAFNPAMTIKASIGDA